MDIMIDIETLANSSNSVITQIAAVVFDRYSGDIIDKFKKNVDTQSCIDIGLEMNVDTIEWWLSQSKEAQSSILEKPRQSIKGVLTDLSTFIQNNWAIQHNNRETFINNPGAYTNLNSLFDSKDVRLWCHATFDEPNLDNAYRKSNIKTPWHFRGVRDLRTLTDLANYEIEKNENTGVAHDALDDCLFQIKYAVKCINILSTLD